MCSSQRVDMLKENSLVLSGLDQKLGFQVVKVQTDTPQIGGDNTDAPYA